MKQVLAVLLLCVLAPPGWAETVVATHTIRAQSVLTAADVQLAKGNTPGAFSAIEDVLGLEARVNLFAGRPVLSGDIGAPAVIDRNQLVRLTFQSGGLSITADGRSLGRAGVGEILRVMNLGSRQTVSGVVQVDGSVVVGSSGPAPLTN
jgi:flagellar basal body P-ring formation protein FlgA